MNLLTFSLVFQTGEKLLELNGHTQKITAITTIPSLEACEEKNQLILTASADRTVIISLNLEESEIAVVTQGTSIDIVSLQPLGACLHIPVLAKRILF